MKKGVKAALFGSIAVVLPAVLNHIIFSRVRQKTESEIPPAASHTYKWRHGLIHYKQSGEGEPLLLVHGVYPGGSLSEWELCIRLLAKHYTVYAIDLLGFGRSDNPNITYSAYLYITLLNDFVKDVIGRRTYIAAHANSGAYAVMACAFEPARYKKMLLIAPTGIGSVCQMPTTCDVFARWAIESPVLGTSLYNLLTSRMCLRWRLRHRYFSNPSTVTAEAVNQFYYSAHTGGAASRIALSAALTKFLNVNIGHKLKKTKIPVQVVWGQDDKVNPVDNLQTAKQINPSITSAVMRNTGHLPHLENPRAFYKSCKHFFGV